MSNNRLSMSKRAIRMVTALALVAVTSVVAVWLLMTGVGGATAFNADTSAPAHAIIIPAQYTEQCSNGIAVLYPSHNPGLLSDCASLLAAKDALEGEDGRRLGWAANSSIGSWQGVSIGISEDNATYRVTYLRLNNPSTRWSAGLTGTLPPELGNLASLRQLLLAGNQLTGPIPSELGSLSNIEYLTLNGNQLTGAIPPELGNLANLEGLTLEYNQLTGVIPSEFGNFANLSNMNLSNNQLTGTIPPELGNLAKLKWLRLNDNQLTGAIPPELGKLTNLRDLTLANNRLTGEIPPELGNLSNISEIGGLTLGGNHFTGCIPASLRRLLDNYGQRAGIGLPFCGDEPVPPDPTPTATASPTPTATSTPRATATATPTPTATPVSYDALLSRLIALETQLAEVLNRLAALEGGSAIAPITPTPTATPSPTPTSVAGTSAGACIERLTGNGSVNGRWTPDCLTANSPDNQTYYARFYTFTLYAASEVTITLSSADATPYLFLLEGEGIGGAVTREMGDANTTSATIIAALQPGAYTIEASTYRAETAGDFTLEMEVAR